MAARTISDEEISLIKIMLDRGMKNRDIQFYFNRPDRPVNSGRITQIRKSEYGSKVPAATGVELNAFLQSVSKSTASASAKRSVGERATEQFEKRGAEWFLKSHETDDAECKTSFHGLKPADRASSAVRAIAGLANNKGGFLFFGVQEQTDKSLKAIGLADERVFSNVDPAELNQVLLSCLDPVPVFQMGLAQIGGRQVAFVEVAKHEGAPVVASKNLGSDVREGAIYYRYVGETRLIRSGELRQLIALRERRAVEQFAKAMGRVAEGSAATLDLDTGQIAGTGAHFLLDPESVKKIQFLREGDFKEKDGAPALKLIGDVRVSGPTDSTRVVRQNITQDDVLINFLEGEPVGEPLEYILSLAHAGRGWLPLWYYVQLSGMEEPEIIAALNSERPTQRKHRDGAIARLLRKKSAYKLHTGSPKKLLGSITDGKLSEPKTPKEDSNFALAIQGLSESASNVEKLRPILLKVASRAQGVDPQTNGRRSNIFRAACRLDEVLYRPF